jgi:hypothetical protein
MHVPAHLQEIARQLALRSWVDGRSFPRESYFETIDGGRELLARHNKDADESRHGVVILIAGALDEEGLLLTHMLDKGTYSRDSSEDREARWFRVCLAAAWVVLQAYEKDCKAGKWPK